MKVLMLSWEYTPHIVGGLGKHVVEIVPPLIEDGVEIHLVVPNLGGGVFNEPLLLPDGSPATNGSQVYRVEASGIEGDFFTNTWHDNILVGEFCKHLIKQEGGFDLIHDHDWLSGFAAISAKHDFHLPLVATIHATEMGRNRGNLYGEMQRSIHQAEWWLTFEAWRIITCSQYMAWEVETYFGAPRGKIDVIPNGVDPRRFDELRGKDLSQFRLGFAQPDEPIVYYVGRMVPEKGLSVLIDAVPLVLREWPGVKFVLAGGGGYANDLKAQANQLGVASSVIFPGRIPDEVRDRPLHGSRLRRIPQPVRALRHCSPRSDGSGHPCGGERRGRSLRSRRYARNGHQGPPERPPVPRVGDIAHATKSPMVGPKSAKRPTRGARGI